MSLFYTRYDSPKETVRVKKLEEGDNYNVLSFFHAAVASRDMPLITYLIEHEKVDVESVSLRRLNFLGFRSKPLTIYEYAKKDNFPELLAYLSEQRERNALNEMIRETDDDDITAAAVASSSSSSSALPPPALHTSPSSSYAAIGSPPPAVPAPPPPSQFHHDIDALHIREAVQALLERAPGKDIYLFQHQVDMSMVSVADHKRCAALATRACWLFTCFISIFTDLPIGAHLCVEARELFISMGVIPPFTSVPFEDLEIYYQRHPFVLLIREQSASTDSRQRSKIVAKFLSIIERFAMLYAEQFSDLDVHQVPPSPSSSSSSSTASTASTASSSDVPSSEPTPLIGTGNENPPEFAGIARGIFGTLGKDQKSVFSQSTSAQPEQS